MTQRFYQSEREQLVASQRRSAQASDSWFYQTGEDEWHPCSAWLAADLATSTTGPNSGPIPVRLGSGEQKETE